MRKSKPEADFRSRPPKSTAKTGRPKLVSVSEEMKSWSAMLEQELNGWPGVSSRPMFGFLSLYRDGLIFAALPRTRAVTTPNSFIFKFNAMPAELLRQARKPPQIDPEKRSPGATWYSLELNSADDLRDALWWLNHAYEAAKDRSGRKQR